MRDIVVLLDGRQPACVLRLVPRILSPLPFLSLFSCPALGLVCRGLKGGSGKVLRMAQIKYIKGLYENEDLIPILNKTI